MPYHYRYCVSADLFGLVNTVSTARSRTENAPFGTGLVAKWSVQLPVGQITAADWQLTTTAVTEAHSVTTTDPLNRVTTMTLRFPIGC